MAKLGYMTEEQAERAVWSFYWQLDNSRDRRIAPIITEPPDSMSPEELEQIRAEQERQKMWKKVQRQIDRRVGDYFGQRVQRGARAVGRAGRKIGRLVTGKDRADYRKAVEEEAYLEALDKQDKKGQLNHATGLPESPNDLNSGRGVVSGVHLCMSAIVPPEDLAAAVTTWLPPCPPDESSEKWGDEMTHWQALAYKARKTACPSCGGRGYNTVRVSRDVSKGLLIRRNKEKVELRNVPCENCNQEGTIENWDQDEIEAVKYNAFLIARKIQDLSTEGFFDKRPVNPNDKEMGDLVWEDETGGTIGFQLTWDGYQRMREYCSRDPEIQQAMHVLALAGKDVREAAPDWAQREFEKGSQIKVEPEALKAAPETLDMSPASGDLGGTSGSLS